MFWGIDIKEGKVKFDDISFLPDSFRVRDHIDYLKEDMLQIHFSNGLLIDVGWRPSFSLAGKFYIVAVQDLEWDPPMAHATAGDVRATKDAITKFVREFT